MNYESLTRPRRPDEADILAQFTEECNKQGFDFQKYLGDCEDIRMLSCEDSNSEKQMHFINQALFKVFVAANEPDKTRSARYCGSIRVTPEIWIDNAKQYVIPALKDVISKING
jgi:hypothetical protein